MKKRVLLYPCPVPTTPEDHEYCRKNYPPPVEAKFIKYGVDFHEFDDGPGNFTSAILKLKDGTIVSRHVDCIRFLPKTWKERLVSVCEDSALAILIISAGFLFFTGMHLAVRFWAQW